MRASVFLCVCMYLCIYYINIYIYIHGARWRIARVDAFRPEGAGFESRSSRHLGKVLHLQLPAAIRRVNSDTASIAVVGSISERLML